MNIQERLEESESDDEAKNNIPQNEPDHFLKVYFDEIKRQIEEKRQYDKRAIDYYYDDILKNIQIYEGECKDSKIINPYLLDVKLEECNDEKKHTNKDLKHFSIDYSKLKDLVCDECCKVGYDVLTSDVFCKYSFNTNTYSQNLTLVSCSYDKTIKLWSLPDGKCTKTLIGHTDWVLCVKSFFDNKILSSSWDKSIKVWSIDTGNCIKTFDTQNVIAFQLIKLTKRLFLSGHVNGDIKLWDINSDIPLKSFLGHYDSIRGLEIVSNRNQLISCSRYENIKIWDLQTFECIKNIKGRYNCISDMRLVADSCNLIVCTVNGTIIKWDLNNSTFAELMICDEKEISGLELLPSNKLAISSKDFTIKILNLETQKVIKTLIGHVNYIECIKALSENILVSCSRDSTIKIWDLVSGECLKTLNGHVDFVKCFEFIEQH